jgi:uncharacterized hydrophobic protein (TIGR00271 family)
MTEDEADQVTGAGAGTGTGTGEVGPPAAHGPDHPSTRRALPPWVNPATVKGVLVILVGLSLLYAPKISESLLQAVLGLGLIVAGLSDLWFTLRRERRTRFGGVLEAVVAIVAGIGLLVWPNVTVGVVGLVLALYLLVRGLVTVLASLRQRRHDRRWVLDFSRGSLSFGLGAIALIMPGAVLAGFLVFVAALAVVVGGVMFGYGLRGAAAEGSRDLDAQTVSQIVVHWIGDRDVGAARRDEIGEALFFEQPARVAKLVSWWVMLLLSVAIATFGILQDSTAVVIGAMLIAPLMTPILGSAAAIVNAWPGRLLRSISLVVLGVAAAVGLAFLIGQWLPSIVPLAANSQITSRVSPNLVDMLIALAAGAAGAYANVDRRVSSSIAGVAIAVALVPPLGVVGLELQAREFNEASGAFLLFLTNFVSIILAAILVFLLTGYADLARVGQNRETIGAALRTVVFAALMILVPLVFTAQGVISSAARQASAQAAVAEWLGEDTTLDTVQVTVDDLSVDVLLRGNGTVPPLADLQDDLTEAFGSPASVRVEYIPSEVQTYTPQDGLSQFGVPTLAPDPSAG